MRSTLLLHPPPPPTPQLLFSLPRSRSLTSIVSLKSPPSWLSRPSSAPSASLFLSLLTFFSSFFLSFFLFSFRQHFLGRVPVPVQPWTRRGRHAADLYRFSHKSSCFCFCFYFFQKPFRQCHSKSLVWWNEFISRLPLAVSSAFFGRLPSDSNDLTWLLCKCQSSLPSFLNAILASWVLEHSKIIKESNRTWTTLIVLSSFSLCRIDHSFWSLHWFVLGRLDLLGFTQLSAIFSRIAKSIRHSTTMQTLLCIQFYPV